MKLFFKKILLNFASFLAKVRYGTNHQIKKSYKPMLAGIFSFCIVFSGIYITASRNLAIKYIKKNIAQSISYLNELGIDIAYDNIEFNSIMFYPLIKINNLKLYNTTSFNDWSINFNAIKAYPNILGTKKLRFTSTEGGIFTFNEFTSEMTSEEAFLDIIVNKNKMDELVLHTENFNIKDFAKINNITFLLKSDKNPEIDSFTTSSYTSMFEVNDVKINGLIDYPLSSNIKLIYMKSNIMGKIQPDDFILTSLESWIQKGGFIDIPNLIIQWDPLTLVGRGNINLNEQFSPNISFNTSSKGLLTLLNDLQQQKILDTSKVFIANIMLKNKAYKINPDDEELTVSTPISYSNNILTIDNLEVKDFTK